VKVNENEESESEQEFSEKLNRSEIEEYVQHETELIYDHIAAVSKKLVDDFELLDTKIA
jgi:hypothetical protein